MAYDSTALVVLVRACLDAAPTTTLRQIAEGSMVGRHTLSRAIRTQLGASFRDLQRATLRSWAEALQTTAPPRSAKEISHALGYGSPRSLARRLPPGSDTAPLGDRVAGRGPVES